MPNNPQPTLNRVALESPVADAATPLAVSDGVESDADAEDSAAPWSPSCSWLSVSFALVYASAGRGVAETPVPLTQDGGSGAVEENVMSAHCMDLLDLPQPKQPVTASAICGRGVPRTL